MTPHLSVSLLGPFEARLDGEPLHKFEYNKVRALLAYLAVEAGQAHTRAGLCALLWPDLPESAARQNLSQSLTQLRNVLGDRQADPPFLLATTDSIQLNPAAHCEVDVGRFTASIAQAEAHAHRAWHLCAPCAARLRESVALYRGDFLAQFYVSDSAPFEEWALFKREQLRQWMLSALERLAQYAEWNADYARAVEYARRQVELEPLQDGAHRALIRLLALSGQQGAALSQYEHFRRTLALELDAEPEPETMALWKQIRAGSRMEELRQLQPPPSCLPIPPTPLIGRENDLEGLSELLLSTTVSTRVVTITGSPGIGKTRLALEVAAQLRLDFADGACFVELAPLDDADLVLSAIAQLLGVKEQAGKTLATALMAHLKDRHLLLVLDNFEHVIEAAPFVAELLASCPALKVLVTSRAPLRIRGEQQYALPPLAPEAALQLFAARARAVRPSFILSAENRQQIASLCAQLDHLPLAIELIAMRARSLSPEELMGQLDQRLPALVHGARDVPQRHRTLHRAIAWSYERLSAEEQRIFAHLGVFANGCTAEAVQSVLGPTGPALPALELLAEVSLVQVQTSAGQTRFSLLQTLGEFALEQLHARGEVQSAQRRHAAFFRQLADAAYEQLLGPEQLQWSARIAAELDNMRAAVRWAQHHDQIEIQLRIATGVFRFCWQRGLTREALGWFEHAFSRRDEAPLGVQSRAFRAAGILAWSLNDYSRAHNWLEEARTTGRLAGDAYAVAAATTNLGLVLTDQGEWELAKAHLSEAIALNLALSDNPHAVKFPQVVLAGLLVRLGDYAAAAELYEEGLRHNRELGDLEGTANALYGVALAAAARGDYESAQRLGEESLATYRSLNHQVGAGWAHYWLGNILRDAGDLDAALAHYQHGLGICLDRNDLAGAAAVLEDLALLLARQSDWPGVARFSGAATAFRERAGVRLTPYEENRRHDLLTACRTALGGAQFAEMWAAGQALSLAQAVALAQGVN